ncbi:hypothetical protein VSR34_08135 [Paraburkholderia sp. JHI2823]|uniref:hypothetical protein n=1 Tax=Paraburkholderia sp. JHI2823 TaxID=3112960 RepID=UPI003173B5A8
MADYADTASVSPSRPERSAPSKQGASSPSFDSPESPAAFSSADEHSLAGEPAGDKGTPPPGEGDDGLRQGTLSGFEPEPAQAAAAAGEEAGVAGDAATAGAVAGATTARRAPRPKRAAAAADVAQQEAPVAFGAPDESASALPGTAFTKTVLPARPADAPTAGDADRVEPSGFSRHEAAQPDALAQRLDALHGALAGQRQISAASSRQLKWVLGAATAAVLASVVFGVAQSVRFDTFANESRAEQARLEAFILKQQSTLDDLTRRLAAPPPAAAPVAESPVASPARAVAAPAPAATHRAAARPAHARHAQKPASKTAH